MKTNQAREINKSEFAAEATRPASDYSPRLIPHHPGAATLLEANLILWQR